MEGTEQFYLDCGSTREFRVQLFNLHAIRYRHGSLQLDRYSWRLQSPPRPYAGPIKQDNARSGFRCWSDHPHLLAGLHAG